MKPTTTFKGAMTLLTGIMILFLALAGSANAARVSLLDEHIGGASASEAKRATDHQAATAEERAGHHHHKKAKPTAEKYCCETKTEYPCCPIWRVPRTRAPSKRSRH